MIKKYCAKRRKCWLPAFSPFPTMFSKAHLPGLVGIKSNKGCKSSHFYYLYLLWLQIDKIVRSYCPKPSTRQQNFRLVQIETNCRQDFEVHFKWKINIIYGRKHCEKRINCFLQAISPFLTMFSTATYVLCIKTRYQEVMGKLFT